MLSIKKQSATSSFAFSLLLFAIIIANYFSCKAYQQKGLFSVVSATSIVFLLVGTVILGISCFTFFQLSAYKTGKLFAAYTFLLGLSISLAPCNQLREPVISILRAACTLASSLLFFQVIGYLTHTAKSSFFKSLHVVLSLVVVGSIVIQIVSLFPSEHLWVYIVSTSELRNCVFLSALFSAFLLLVNYKKSNVFAKKQIKILFVGLSVGIVVYLAAATIPNIYLVQPNGHTGGAMVELWLEPTETTIFSVPLLLLSVISITIIFVLLKREFALKDTQLKLSDYLVLPVRTVIPLALMFTYTNCPLWLLTCVALFLFLPTVIESCKRLGYNSDKLEEQAYQTRLIAAIENEKQELSSYLHDEVLQALIAFYRKIQTDDSDRYKGVAKDLASLISEVRGISHNLYPTMVEDLGLEQSLRIFLNELQASYPEIKIAFHYDFQGGILPKQFSLGVYRIVKELATNAAKHSGAQTINCDLSEDKHGYYLRIKDNGTGFSLPDSGELLNTPHMGLYTTQKRIHELQGQGEIIGLLGKNGAGKTTMMKSILGLLNHSGTVLFDGHPLDPRDWRTMNSIGVLVDTAFFEDMTASDNLKILMLSTPWRDNSHLREDIASLLSFVGLEDSGRDKVKGFSFGMKQRLALAQALISEPKLLILDEPFVGLDPLGVVLVKDKLIELCREKKTSIIFSSHQLTEVAELAEDLVVIEDGYVKYFGTYADLERRNKEYRIITDKIVSPAILQELTVRGIAVVAIEGKPHIVLSHGETSLDPLLRQLQSSGYTICEIIREDRPLETLFA